MPRPVSGELGAVRVAGIACGSYATAAWDGGGQLFTWGRAGAGQLGHGSTSVDEPSPRTVEALEGVRIVQVAFGGQQLGGEHTGFMMARSYAGVLYSCGSPERGRLGRPSSSACSEDEDEDEAAEAAAHAVHQAIPGEVRLATGRPTPVTHVAASENHAAAATSDGAIFVWGAHDHGVLGEARRDLHTPAAVPAPHIVAVACSAHATACVTARGAVILIGGAAAPTSTPRVASLPGQVRALFGGGAAIAVLLSNGEAELRKPDGRVVTAGGARGAAAARGATDELGPLPAEFEGVVDPAIAHMLLDSCEGASAIQLAHEVRLLRDLAAAERAKLEAHGYAFPDEAMGGEERGAESGGADGRRPGRAA